MTVVYQYTQKEHSEALQAILIKQAVESMLHKGFYFQGVPVKNISEFIIKVHPKFQRP
jgi:hypothetical protein